MIKLKAKIRVVLFGTTAGFESIEDLIGHPDLFNFY